MPHGRVGSRRPFARRRCCRRGPARPLAPAAQGERSEARGTQGTQVRRRGAVPRRDHSHGSSAREVARTQAAAGRRTAPSSGSAFARWAQAMARAAPSTGVDPTLACERSLGARGPCVRRKAASDPSGRNLVTSPATTTAERGRDATTIRTHQSRHLPAHYHGKLRRGPASEYQDPNRICDDRCFV